MVHSSCKANLGKGNLIAVDIEAVLVSADRSVLRSWRDGVYRTLGTAKVGVAAKPIKGRLAQGHCVSDFTKPERNKGGVLFQDRGLRLAKNRPGW